MANKILPFDVALKEINPIRSFDCPKAYTNDLNSVEFQFTLTDMSEAELVGATANVVLYMRDKSFFQNTPATGVTLTGNIVNYVMKENEGNHAGIAQVQVEIVYADPAKVLSSKKYNFEIVNGLEMEVAVEVIIEDWSSLVAGAEEYIAAAEAAEAIRLQSEIDRVAAENIRLANDIDRPIYHYVTQAEYDALTIEEQNDPKHIYEVTDSNGEVLDELTGFITGMQTQFDNAISATTVDSETINARVDKSNVVHPTLKVRLDNDKSITEQSLVSLNEQLAEAKDDILLINRGLGTTINSLALLNSTYPTGDTKDHIVAGNIAEVDTLTVTGIPTTAGNVTVTLNGVAKTVPVTVGVAEVASLLVTAVPTVAGNVTVTLNGVAKDIAIDPTVETTTDLVAAKIRATLFGGWPTSGTGSTVIFSSSSVGTRVDAVYSAGTTGATGTMTTTTQGVAAATTTIVATAIRASSYPGWTTGGTGAVVTFTATATGAKTAPVFSGGITGTTATFAITTKGEDANGHRYFWNDTIWADGGAYQAVEISDRAVTKYKLADDVLNGKDLMVDGKNLLIRFNEEDMVSSVAPTDTNLVFATVSENGIKKYTIVTNSNYVKDTTPVASFKQEKVYLTTDLVLKFKYKSTASGSFTLRRYDATDTIISTEYINFAVAGAETTVTYNIPKNTTSYVVLMWVGVSGISSGANDIYFTNFDLYDPTVITRGGLDVKIAKIESIDASVISLENVVSPPVKKARILLGFDNSQQDLYLKAFPLLQTRGFKGTFAWQSGQLPGVGYTLTKAQFDEMVAAGWDHAMYRYLYDGTNETLDVTNWADYPVLYASLKAYVDNLEASGVPLPVTYFAPNNLPGEPLTLALKTLGFKICRAYANYKVTPYIEQYKYDDFIVKCATIRDTSDYLNVDKALIDTAIANGYALNIFAHKVVDTEDLDGLNVSIATYTALLDYIKTKVDAGLCEVVTFKEFYELSAVPRFAVSDVDYQRLLKRVEALEPV